MCYRYMYEGNECHHQRRERCGNVTVKNKREKRSYDIFSTITMSFPSQSQFQLTFHLYLKVNIV